MSQNISLIWPSVSMYSGEWWNTKMQKKRQQELTRRQVQTHLIKISLFKIQPWTFAWASIWQRMYFSLNAISEGIQVFIKFTCACVISYATIVVIPQYLGFISASGVSPR